MMARLQVLTRRFFTTAAMCDPCGCGRRVKCFFATATTVLADVNPALAETLRQASPHWLRHSHASHALEAGADLTTVRDNLRHASVPTTSLYLHADDERRARQIGVAFSGSKPR
jgi:hypothetical protein